MFNLIWRDIKTMLSDRQAFLTLIVMPIILTSILGVALSGVFKNDVPITKPKVAIVYDYNEQGVHDVLKDTLIRQFLNEEQLGKLPTEMSDFKVIFEEKLLNNKAVKSLIEYKVMDYETAYASVKEKRYNSMVVFDDDFYKGYIINQTTPFKADASIKILSNSENYLKRQLVSTLIKEYAQMTNEALTIKNFTIKKILASPSRNLASLGGLIQQVYKDNEQLPIAFKDIPLSGQKTINSKSYYAAAMLAMFLLFVAGHGSRLMLDEKNDHTMYRLYMSGVSKWKILSSKLVLMVLMGIVQCTVLILFSSLVLGVDWGSLLPLAVISLATIIAISGLGLLLAVYTFSSNNYKLANLLESFIFQIMAFLGGSFIPITVLPKFLKPISNWMINGIALDAILKNMQGYNLDNVIINLFRLLFIGVACLVLASYLFNRGGAVYDGDGLAKIKGA